LSLLYEMIYLGLVVVVRKRERCSEVDDAYIARSF
jgi:hypothetical protein